MRKVTRLVSEKEKKEGEKKRLDSTAYPLSVYLSIFLPLLRYRVFLKRGEKKKEGGGRGSRFREGRKKEKRREGRACGIARFTILPFFPHGHRQGRRENCREVLVEVEKRKREEERPAKACRPSFLRRCYRWKHGSKGRREGEKEKKGPRLIRISSQIHFAVTAGEKKF